MFFRYNLYALVWAAFIFVLCVLSGEEFPDLSFWSFFTFDKAAHAFVFAVLVLLLTVGFIKQYTYKSLRYIAVPAAATISLLYGALTETMQMFLQNGRMADVMDFIANSVGVVIGVLLFHIIYGKVSNLKY